MTFYYIIFCVVNKWNILFSLILGGGSTDIFPYIGSYNMKYFFPLSIFKSQKHFYTTEINFL
jgi:hypothetical protein